jgi:hypothetical protein
MFLIFSLQMRSESDLNLYVHSEKTFDQDLFLKPIFTPYILYGGIVSCIANRKQ